MAGWPPPQTPPFFGCCCAATCAQPAQGPVPPSFQTACSGGPACILLLQSTALQSTALHWYLLGGGYAPACLLWDSCGAACPRAAAVATAAAASSVLLSRPGRHLCVAVLPAARPPGFGGRPLGCLLCHQAVCQDELVLAAGLTDDQRDLHRRWCGGAGTEREPGACQPSCHRTKQAGNPMSTKWQGWGGSRCGAAAPGVKWCHLPSTM
jgi:hypothetical protein